jgi:Flp pilus assembly protein TadD
MKERPEDAEGWTMLARSYTVLGRYTDAVPAYRRAAELQPANASLLADYADAVAATKGNVINPESAALIERALAADPKNPKALALAGTLVPTTYVGHPFWAAPDAAAKQQQQVHFFKNLGLLGGLLLAAADTGGRESLPHAASRVSRRTAKQAKQAAKSLPPKH